MIEEWKVIEEFPNYLVSNLGNVKSLNYNKILKEHKGSCGYRNVFLYNGVNKKFTKKIHRLVGAAFIANPLNKPQINHIDGNKTNNNVLNLEWVNNSENALHAFRIGLKSPPKGERNGCTKILDSDIIRIRELLNTNIKQVRIAEMFNISKQVISRIKLGIRKMTHEF